MMNRMHWLLKAQFFWLAMTLAAVVGFRGSLLTWRPALMLAAAALGGLVLTGFVSLLVLFARLRVGRRDGSASCLWAAGLSLPALVGVLLMGIQGVQAPPIHDIATDPDNPPLFRAAPTLRQAGDNPIDYPGEETAGRQRQAHPDIAPLLVAMPPEAAFGKSAAVAEQLGWRIVARSREQGVIEAVDRTLIFGFTDDIVIRIEATASGSRIDLRSASRAGVGDLGVNAKRIRAFVAAFTNSQPKT